VARARPWWLRPILDWRVWVGLGVTALAIWVTLRGVDLREVGRELAAAHPGWLGVMAVTHLVSLWVRAVRWGFLTRALRDEPITVGPLFRATAVGFMTLNILPLRIGELARPWLLSRETGVRGSAALGTVVLERAIDFATIAIIGGAVLYFHTQTLPAWVRTGAVVFVLLACIPFVLVIALRMREELTLTLLERLFGLLPGGIGPRVLDMVREVCRGLNGLQGARLVIGVVLWSVVLWMIVIPLTFLFGLYAFDIQLGTRGDLLASYTAQVFTAMAVAAPSAPGFFGVYHVACREALALFGVSTAVAVAYGTAVHLSYWLPTTLVGLWCAVQSGAHLADLAAADVSKAPSPAHR
jgi:uncharacterized protein (TIRG00374 family)